jgi:hypothetical protein
MGYDQTMAADSVRILELRKEDLRIAASLCIEAFFGPPDRNPIRTLQLQTLLDEALADLKKRFGRSGSTMLKAVDANGAMIGFVEVTVRAGE